MNIQRSRLALEIFLFITITGYVIGYLGLIDFFASWDSIGNPPDKPLKILAGETFDYPGGLFYHGRQTTVYIQTESGKIYSCCSDEKSSWIEKQRTEIHELSFSDCLNSRDERHLVDEIDNRAVYYCGEWDAGATYYAIRKDGTVWQQRLYGRSYDIFIQLCGYPILGFLISVVVKIGLPKQKEKYPPARMTS